ncbi:hypothetical protein Syn7502_03233 [Synechococcus sp. PCC 7502]|uniref:hypothetical protein n=1 Tax=Synechococcus sp. PCC 7502 TaxID=1173263 RepID=UPI00029FB2B9|nr:hypothetical protein [Synechococcus sp. PCC 7502]AFY75107.1 hypothetical protein Syn7502_03233 [Synechococcus sp. PCC 7502]
MSATIEYVICINLPTKDRGLQPFCIANYEFDPELTKDERFIVSFELLEFQTIDHPSRVEKKEIKRQFTFESKVERITKYLMKDKVMIIIHISPIENNESLNQLTLSYEPNQYHKMAKVPEWLDKLKF